MWQRARSRRRLNSIDNRLQRVKLLRFLALGAVFAVLFGIVGFFAVFAWYSRGLPKPGEVVRRDGFSTKIFDRKGELLYDLFGDERRDPVRSEEIPAHLKQATVAIEDKDFYKHGGFDFLTILRIPYNFIVRQRVVGGSTLTQQLVKKALLSDERTLERKFKEFVLSIQIERTFTKDQILEMYLNEVPYGGTALGVGTASHIYFDKPVSELSIAEAAVLAGLPQRPTAYSPLLAKKDDQDNLLWKIRAETVLSAMRRDGYLTDLSFDEARSQLDTLAFASGSAEIRAPHFVFYVQRVLEEMYGEEVLQQGGLQVTTSLDLALQEEAQKIVADEISKIVQWNVTNGSLVAMDPKTGEILSMVGSRNYFDKEIDGQFNVAADGLRQPGSSIKPITYLALLKRGYTPASILVDAPTDFRQNDQIDAYTPRNYDGKFHGPVSLRNALGSSLNIPAVKAVALVGVGDFLQQAYDLGLDTLEPTKQNMQNFGFAVTLGGAEVHLVDMVEAYSSFANSGLKVEPVAILKVTDKDGNTLFEHHPVEGRRVITDEEAFLINNMLSDNTARIMAFGPNSLLNTGKPIAVKTGTTNDLKDNWTIGWSQDLIVGVWVGNNDSTPMKQVASGITGASPIWRRTIMAGLGMGYEAPDWVMPQGVEQVELDAISGYSKHDDFPARTDYVIKNTMPGLPDPVHIKMKVCRDDQSKLATLAKVAAGDYEEREYIVLREDDPVSEDGKNRWQDGIMSWIQGQEDSRYKYPTEYCGQSSDVSVKLIEPQDHQEFGGDQVKVKVEAGSDDGVEKIEIVIDGQIKETVSASKYEGNFTLGAGQHEIQAKVKSRGGKEAATGVAHIGTGGQPWQAPTPTPLPSPTPVPTVAPTVTPPVIILPT